MQILWYETFLKPQHSNAITDVKSLQTFTSTNHSDIDIMSQRIYLHIT